MTDFTLAYKEGLNAAKQAKKARTEIDDVFKDLNRQLMEATEGKISIERRRMQRESSTFGIVFDMVNPRPKYWAVVAFSPKIKASPIHTLCEWESAKDGYPCKLEWDGDEFYCEDKQALENNLADLLRDPRIAETLQALVNRKTDE